MNKQSQNQSLGRSFAIFLISSVFGIAGLVGTASLFDRMNWAYFHSWALMHGSGFICILFWSFIGYHLAKLVFGTRGQLSPIPNLAYACSAVGTFPFLLYNQMFMWVGILLTWAGLYSRLRNGNKAAAGLMWAASIVSLLTLTYWAYLKWMISGAVKALK